jgi:trans-2-enoyl-CoA reductase
MNYARLLLARSSNLIPKRNGYRLVIKEHGNPLKSQELQKQDRPKVTNPDEVLVGVLAATVNPADVNIVEGTYPIRPKLPGTGGLDGIAEVLEVGSNVKMFKPGDRVWPFTLKLGMYRTYLTCKEDQLVLADKRLSIVQAATIQANPTTAYRMIKWGNLKRGDTLVQNAGNGAVGQNVIQICKAWGINTVSIIRSVYSDLHEIKQWMRALGATYILTDQEVDNEAITGDLWKKIPRPRHFLNCVGGEQIMHVANMMQEGGTIVTYGGMSLKPAMIPSDALIYKDLKAIGFWLSRRDITPQTKADYKEWQNMMNELSELAVHGDLKPPVCELRPAQEWLKAFEMTWWKTAGPEDKVIHRPKQLLGFYDPQIGD